MKPGNSRSQRTRFLALAVVAAMLMTSGIALADSHDVEEPEDTRNDTLFSFGYDLVNRLLVWNISVLGGQYDCTLENGTLTATYGEEGESGVIPVDGLEDEDGVVVFPARPEDELDEGVEPADGPADYEGADGPCGVVAADVTGPSGQVNHGMFMKLFNSLFEGTGRGCLVRHLAGSDLGKGPQQVKVGESDSDSSDPATTGEVDFTSVEADCDKAKPTGEEAEEDSEGVGNGKGNGNGKGKPASPGNSGSAPGKNK